MKNDNIKQKRTIQRTHIEHNSFGKKNFVDVSMAVTVQSCGVKKHQVQMVKIERKYSRAKADEHKAARVDEMLLYTVRGLE